MIRTKTTYLNLLSQYKKSCAEKYGILSIGIFGSVARGEQRENSDVDVVVELKESDYFIFCAIQEELEALFSCKVDLVQKHPFMRPLFLKNIEKDAIMA